MTPFLSGLDPTLEENIDLHSSSEPRFFGRNITNAHRIRPHFSEKPVVDVEPITPSRTPIQHRNSAKRIRFNEKTPTKSALPNTPETSKCSHARKNRSVAKFAEKSNVTVNTWANSVSVYEDLSLTPSKIGKSSLGSFISTRSLELQIPGRLDDLKVIDTPEQHDWQQWNEEVSFNSKYVVINPRKCPLDRAKLVKYSDQVLVAVKNPYPEAI